jgi:hypothetical protein
MKYIFALLGLVLTYILIKFRESIGDSIGDADWMRFVGGVYNLIILCAILIFFWSIAIFTGTERLFFTPILWLLPGANNAQPAVTGGGLY